MKNDKLKYCILAKEINPTSCKNIAAAGFLQWLNVFGGELVVASQLLPRLKDEDYDIIHILLTEENWKLVSSVRRKIGRKSKTKIVVCFDIQLPLWKQDSSWVRGIKKNVRKADIVYCNEYSIAEALEYLTSQKIYEIAHPADIGKLKSFNYPKKKDCLTILYNNSFNGYHELTDMVDANSTRLMVIASANEEVLVPKDNKLEVIYCRDDSSIIKTIAESNTVLIPYTNPGCGELVIYAATQKCLVIGNLITDAQRRCYALSTLRDSNPPGIIGYYEYYSELIKQDSLTEFIKEFASEKAEYYNWENSKKALLDLLYLKTGDSRFHYLTKENFEVNSSKSFYSQIKKIHGKRNVEYAKNEFVVICLVKDGMTHIPSFLNYYRKMGAKHFFFIDDSSKDNTQEYLKQFEDVTVYHNHLLYKSYECEIRAEIIKQHCRGKWCLCVDIDEFFEFPCNETISMQQFLEYLNSKKYTAVVAHMLDMFSEELSFDSSDDDGDMLGKYCYYDNSQLKKGLYSSFCEVFSFYNKLSDKQMNYFYGGVRSKYFDQSSSKYLLIKHPLLFIDNKTEPFTHPHYSNKVHIADVSCLLRHFKFVNSFKQKVETLTDSYIFFAQNEYLAYQNAFKDKNTFSLFSENAKKLECIDQLLDEGFITLSDDYKTYCNSMIANNFKKKSTFFGLFSNIFRLSQNSF